MKIIAISFLVVVGLICCEKDNNSLKTNSGLTGTWEWIRTDGGFAFNIHESPATTGFTCLLKFIDEKKFVIYENEIEVFSGDYTIVQEKSIYSGELEDYIRITGSCQIPNLVINGIINIDNQFLTISDNCYDGVGSRYERLK